MQIAAFDHFPVSNLTAEEVLISSLSIVRFINTECDTETFREIHYVTWLTILVMKLLFVDMQAILCDKIKNVRWPLLMGI